jgi:putative copper export protein
LVAALLFALHRRMGGVDFQGIFATMGKALLGSIVFVGVTYGLLQVPYLQSIQTNKLGAVLILLLVCLPGFSLYVVIARALKMPETAALDRTFDKIRGRVGR